ncbi:MAG TPA: GNAT family N-acetyltransferase [Verrucomicrobiae bacterium]|jgi:GNAT superfamily N-acetyltransferase|nr:GNAT family N-acetyltransferase [Verrucomicrobiae bacterium]
MSITPITPAQVPVILEMVRELAQFERLEHEAQATEESLQQAFFGPQANAGAWLAEVDGRPAGYAIYYFTFSSFIGRRGLWLDDLYVRPDFRRRGVGRALLATVARFSVEKNCGRLEWSALRWNETALNFYRGVGARPLDEWTVLRMDVAAMRRLAAGRASGS